MREPWSVAPWLCARACTRVSNPIHPTPPDSPRLLGEEAQLVGGTSVYESASEAVFAAAVAPASCSGRLTAISSAAAAAGRCLALVPCFAGGPGDARIKRKCRSVRAASVADGGTGISTQRRATGSVSLQCCLHIPANALQLTRRQRSHSSEVQPVGCLQTCCLPHTLHAAPVRLGRADGALGSGSHGAAGFSPTSDRMSMAFSASCCHAAGGACCRLAPLPG